MSDALTGQLLALLSAVAFACSNVFISKGASGGGDRGVMFSVLVTMVFSGLLWLTLEGGSLGTGNPDEWWAGIGWFVLAGILAMVFGRTFLLASIRKLGVTRASAVKRLNPFFSVLFAFALLGEPITGLDGLGIVGIALAFGLLIRRSFQRSAADIEAQAAPPSLASYGWGVGSALSYALAYITRKYGLLLVAAPAFGTMVSAVSGFTFFVIAAIFVSQYRVNFRNMFRNLNVWLVLAAFTVSLGQILLFAALFYEKVSTVVMIASLEIFIASFLSVVVFRTEARPDLETYIAATIATAGVIAIAWN
ncbi:MAG: DMT family transporter [Marinobacter sp.]|uniref:DMT family transporter n=1 Tax=Marinobacter sp. TaxID=50741 RepID=UPI003298CC58